ncbi:hypothetical protein SEVIR_1G020900v4 [Setaria viridis]|nr:hypothetical protein SEVIR_1G020900v2 [Setaria viridis]
MTNDDELDWGADEAETEADGAPRPIHGGHWLYKGARTPPTVRCLSPSAAGQFEPFRRRFVVLQTKSSPARAWLPLRQLLPRSSPSQPQAPSSPPMSVPPTAPSVRSSSGWRPHMSTAELPHAGPRVDFAWIR